MKQTHQNDRSAGQQINHLLQRLRRITPQTNAVELAAIERDLALFFIGEHLAVSLTTNEARGFLLPRTNYKLEVVNACAEPKFIISSGRLVATAHKEEYAFAMLALLQRRRDFKEYKGRYNAIALKEALTNQNMENRRWCHQERYHQSSYHIFHVRNGLILSIDSQTNESLIGVPNNTGVFNEDSFKHRNFITVGQNGKWLGDGPWCHLYDEAMAAISAEIRGAELMAKAKAIQLKQDQQLELEKQLNRAFDILWNVERMQDQPLDEITTENVEVASINHEPVVAPSHAQIRKKSIFGF